MINKYSQKNKEGLLKEAPERYQHFSKKEKIGGKRSETDRKIFLKKKKKQKLREYMEKYYSVHKK